MFNREKFKSLCIERDAIFGESYWELEIIWKEIVLLIIEDDDSMRDFIEYMKLEMTGNEYGVLSEISDEIVTEKPSIDFIVAYKELSKKYPDETKRWQIQSFINDAEKIVEQSLSLQEAESDAEEKK